MTIDDELAKGIAAVRAGQRELARQHLQKVLLTDSKNESAWLWLSGVVETRTQKRDCLQIVLSINPDNTAARRGLEELAQSEAADFLSTFEPHRPPAAPTPPPAPAVAPTPAPIISAPPPIVGTPASFDEPPAEMFQPLPIELDQPLPGFGFAPMVTEVSPEPSAVASSPTSNVPKPPQNLEAPCAFCGTPTQSTGECSNCGTEQTFDCPNCGHVLDVRENWICECGHSFENFLTPERKLDRERLAQMYSDRDFPAAAVKQWKAALPTSRRPQLLHAAIGRVYDNLGLYEQAEMHYRLSKQK
ncbi:zinc ribbon domain-containing protein [Herpetosiphon geysericola]|uniref:DZANK-type domain-containing protein n=1 Tax=Herpetosiphon geysericola TaxID=70996 RepID=A0A0P6XEG2_9CHLR|nr:zinc ribbon domain-containing protein [Herpetosiphon geysericola]KPL81477.1 hypothetical protein SE18_22880 [Herpetosiphon geysericola]